jgi:hypothetical protein
MNVEIGTETQIILFWEYLFQNFDILSLQCRGNTPWGTPGIRKFLFYVQNVPSQGIPWVYPRYKPVLDLGYGGVDPGETVYCKNCLRLCTLCKKFERCLPQVGVKAGSQPGWSVGQTSWAPVALAKLVLVLPQ